MGKPKIIRASTIPLSLNVLLKGQLQFLSKHFEVIGLASNGSEMSEVQKREGIATLTVDMQRNISPFKDLIALFKLYFVFKKEKPLIVHSITPKAGLLSMLAAKAAGVPIRMHTFTGLVFPSRTGFIQKILIKTDQILCGAATHVYPEGQGVKNDLIRFGITSKPLKIIANGNVNGIDVSYFDTAHFSTSEIEALKTKWNIQPTDFVFVFVGRLVRDKGINELIVAFKNLATKQQNVKLLLVGNYEQELDPLLPETINAIESEPQIVSVGYQNDVRPFFAIANALVFPSYREGFPNVVLQAGAMGLPSIVTDINGCNEIIENKINGLIIPSKDANAIEKAMEIYLTDVNFYNFTKSNARQKITEKFDQLIVWNALLSEYQSVISSQTKNK
jgi:glycosyltransferase involved in cell wall biosynthesis